MTVFRRAIPLLGALLLAACAATGARNNAADGGQGQPLASLPPPAPNAREAVMTDVMAGEFALAKGDTAAASQSYGRAASASADPKVAATAAHLAADEGQADAAEAAIARMQATGASARAVTRERARVALLRGHREEARAALAALLKPGDDAAWASFARLLAQARDPALAGVLLEELASPATLPPDDASIWVAVSQLGEQLNRHMYADRIARAAADRFATAPAYAWAAHLALLAGREDQGFALYAKGVARHPDDTRLRRSYAAALGKADRDHDALRVLGEGPQDFDTLAARAAYAARLEDQPELRRVYAALRKNRAHYDHDISFLLGQLAEALGKPEQAATYYAEVPADDEHAFDARVRQAVLLDERGDAERAHAVARALQREYTDDSDLLRRGFLLDAQLYVRAGQSAQAIAAYDRGLAALPEDVGLLYGRALSEADAGQTEAAIADLRKILALQPDDVDAMNALGYTLADEGLHLDEAEALLRKALAAQPDEPAIIDSWGWLQYRQGNLQAAEKALRKAWGLRKDPDIGVHLGEVLWKLGRQGDAEKVFDAVRHDDPDNVALTRTLARLQP